MSFAHLHVHTEYSLLAKYMYLLPCGLSYH